MAYLREDSPRCPTTPNGSAFDPLACCGLPVQAVVLLDSTVYNGWRHLYFLYAPFCLLATEGLHALTTATRGGGAGRTA